ncbi:DUF433 domain-containing protein [Candidatus Chloroploca sp. Khr17]|uniref:DUF433 domain-containing protein n=1 Tax=Candidatus Chloroploca sp. Khr17 TaxID=2496869 RepID=UPI00101DE1BF|nr:DUF433 domain-containing protein [Candidatus Chloroploca sp. Khr17]
MNLEAYFTILAPDDIRITRTRIGIESVLYEYVHRGQAAEAIAAHFPSLSLEHVDATILWYLRDQERLATYLATWLASSAAAQATQDRDPPPVVRKLRQRRTVQEAAS